MLTRTEHSWPDGVDPPVPYSVQCSECGYVLGPNQSPRPLCPGDPDERSTLDRSTGSLKRSTPLRDVSPDRARKRAQIGAYGPYHRWISRRQPCLLSGYDFTNGCRGDVVGHHVKTVGSGHGDFIRTNDGRLVGNEVPFCMKHHRMVERNGRTTFEQEFNLDLRHWAELYAEQWDGQPYDSYDPE